MIMHDQWGCTVADRGPFQHSESSEVCFIIVQLEPLKPYRMADLYYYGHLK